MLESPNVKCRLITFVLAHRKLRLNLFHDFNDNRHDDKKRGAAQSQGLNTGKVAHHERQNGNDGQKQRAEENDFVGDAAQVLLGVLAGPDARNERALLLQILGNALGMKNNLGVKKSKTEYQNEIQNGVDELIIKKLNRPLRR